MTVDEAFEEWKKTAYVGILCSCGGLEGGPGYLGFGECKHPNHKDVRYGCNSCPKNCLDFRADVATQFQTFLSLYRNNPRFISDCENDGYKITELQDEVTIENCGEPVATPYSSQFDYTGMWIKHFQ